MNNLNCYKLISSLINEMATGALVKQGFKDIGRNIKHDPTSLALTAVPYPGHFIIGPSVHIAKNPGSRKKLAVMGRRLITPSKW